MALYKGTELISGATTLVGESRNVGQIIQSTIPLTDAGLHLLDGALINGNGIYSAFVDYIAELYDNTPSGGYKYNVKIVGSLTNNDGVLSGFNTSNYAKTNVTLNLSGVDTWEIVTKQNISSVSSINDGYMGVLGGAYNVNYYINDANKITLELSSNGTSYDIGYIPMLSAITLNTDFYLKTEFTGTAYNLYYSTDGETWTLQGSISSSTKVSNRTNNFAFGVDEAGSHMSWVGSIDLKGCYINTNGVRLWTGVEETKPIFCTEEQWQASVTNYGVCGKFVYDNVNNTVRLPKVKGFTEGTITPTTLGNITQAGLPNIAGTFTNYYGENIYGDGAFLVTSSAGQHKGGLSTNWATSGMTFDASRSSSIYGNSSTVQPQSIKVLYYIVIATSTKTDIEVDIDEIATDLNGKVDKSSLTQVYPVTETYVNGNDWYRIWAPDSTGYRWCEQGSLYYKGSTLANTDNDIIFLKPFKDVNYNFIPTPIHNTANITVYQIYEKYSSRTTSTTVLRIPGAIFGYAWVARGYIKDDV